MTAFNEDSSWGNRKLKTKTKTLKLKIWLRYVHGGIWKLLNFLGNLERYTYNQGYEHAKERPEKALISHVWLTLRLGECEKQRQE